MAKSLAVISRPKTVSGIVGQESVKAELTNIFNGDSPIPAAIALIGNTGCGKTTIARMIARTLNCAKGKGCGKCDSCVIFDADPNNHPDFKNANAATDGGKNEIKELVELSRYSPTFKLRVILIDEAHAMTPAGKEALLLDLEEPSEQTMFILATTEPHKLPVTLLGRCQKMILTPVPVEELAALLVKIAKKAKIELPAKAATRIAEYSGGHPRNAISSLESTINKVTKNSKLSIGDAIEQSFYNADEVAQSEIIAGLLILLYEGKTAAAVGRIGSLNDMVGATIKMSMMNGFAMFNLMKMGDKDVKNPYYATPEARMLWTAIAPDLKKKETRKLYFRKALELTGRITKLRGELMTAGVVDSTSIVIANLVV